MSSGRSLEGRRPKYILEEVGGYLKGDMCGPLTERAMYLLSLVKGDSGWHSPKEYSQSIKPQDKVATLNPVLSAGLRVLGEGE